MRETSAPSKDSVLMCFLTFSPVDFCKDGSMAAA